MKWRGHLDSGLNLNQPHPATFSHSSHCFREKIDQEHDIGDANVTVAIFADELGFVWVVTYQVLKKEGPWGRVGLLLASCLWQDPA
jgi:hypothetical protein